MPKSYNNSLYVLDFLSYKVKIAFYDSVATHYSHLDAGEGQNDTCRLIESMTTGNLEDFFATLGVFFANIPYNLNFGMANHPSGSFYKAYFSTA